LNETAVYRILVAVDGSERADRAARFAIDLARRVGDAQLHLVNVQDPVDESQTHGLGRDAIRQHRGSIAAATASTAKALAERAGVRCSFDWHFGEPARVLADIASSTQCNVLVMGTQGAGAIQNLLLGSVAQRTLHLSSVPVALVR
jgi:nucleotide-binding universal stress UspA family protein